MERAFEHCYAVKKITEAVFVAGREVGLEANAENTTCIVTSYEENAGQSRSVQSLAARGNVQTSGTGTRRYEVHVWRH
jgi:hypothetical protein